MIFCVVCTLISHIILKWIIWAFIFKRVSEYLFYKKINDIFILLIGIIFIHIFILWINIFKFDHILIYTSSECCMILDFTLISSLFPVYLCVQMFKGFDKAKDIQYVYTPVFSSLCGVKLDSNNKAGYLLSGEAQSVTRAHGRYPTGCIMTLDIIGPRGKIIFN